jgi:D-psicose/D-tagatose/L-ribulose 3-epimerase
MKFGANTFIWTSPFTTANTVVMEKVAAMGFDVFEIAVEDPSLLHRGTLKDALKRTKLAPIVCGVFGSDRNLSSPNEKERTNAVNYLHWCIDTAAEIEAPIVCGPMYAAVGVFPSEDEGNRQREWDRSVIHLQELAAYAGQSGVKLAFEPLNRFETGMINTVQQGLQLIADVGSPHLGLHLDTFHMHLEEKDAGAAIRMAGDRLFHLHASENDRGIPGSGQVHWPQVARALNDIQYKGAVVIESFTPEVQSIARAVCLWREVAPSQDAIAIDGLRFLKRLFDEMGTEL